MRSARGIGHIDVALMLHLRSQGAKSITVIHREKSPKGVDVEKERRGIENSASHLERSRGAQFYAWSMAETEAAGTGDEVHPSALDRRAGDVWLVGCIPAKRRLETVRRLGTLDPVRVGEKIITDAYQYHETCAALCPTGALRTDGKGAVYCRANLREAQDMSSLLRRRRRPTSGARNLKRC